MSSFYPRNAPTPQCTAQTTGYKLISNRSSPLGTGLKILFIPPPHRFPLKKKKSFYKLPKIELIYPGGRGGPRCQLTVASWGLAEASLAISSLCLWGLLFLDSASRGFRNFL